MLGRAGFLSGLPKPALDGMIDVIKGIEPDSGYGPILKVSEMESLRCENQEFGELRLSAPIAVSAAVSTFGPRIGRS